MTNTCNVYNITFTSFEPTMTINNTYHQVYLSSISFFFKVLTEALGLTSNHLQITSLLSTSLLAAFLLPQICCMSTLSTPDTASPKLFHYFIIAQNSQLRLYFDPLCHVCISYSSYSSDDHGTLIKVNQKQIKAVTSVSYNSIPEHYISWLFVLTSG